MIAIANQSAAHDLPTIDNLSADDNLTAKAGVADTPYTSWPSLTHGAAIGHDSLLFSVIADDLHYQGYSVQSTGFDLQFAESLSQQAQELSIANYRPAAIGRHQSQQLNRGVRGDKICWIESQQSMITDRWLQWSEQFKLYLNRTLYLGLNTFESHFANYKPGDFYKTHIDAFQGYGNRRLSVVLYLNDHWSADDGGQLMLYPESLSTSVKAERSTKTLPPLIPISVLPEMATVAVFLSEKMPHEVLPTHRDRYSIAGWFR